VNILYCSFNSFLGPVFSAATKRGICWLSFDSQQDGIKKLKSKYGRNLLAQKDLKLQNKIKAIFEHLKISKEYPDYPIDPQGTKFQQKVWNLLKKIPPGKTFSYQEVARKIQAPKAVRAVGSACARNPVGLLIPCHRVLRSNGELGGFAWGLELKKKLLSLEQKTISKSASI
jgi:AraC family transcriptional regulator, regulatory protein of adaptative response / methylated-DNA-[protein]-cysteine methyltransferase